MCIVEILSALLTPLIAVIAVYTAYQQYLVNKRRLNHELYEKRLKIYQETTQFISSILRSGKTDIKDLLDFYSKCAESTFLFGDEIPAYVETLWDKGLYLVELSEKLYGEEKLPAGDEPSNASTEKMGLSGWFRSESETLKDKFRPYLSVTKQFI